jgi:hypothetical protein
MQQYDPGAQCQRTGGRCFLNRSGNRPRENYAFFEFAPASGAGMGTACACTTPTSAKGDALTFTRAGDATCSKQGLATTGIANGDLVVCATDQPRVESSGGVLGLRVESARTNQALRSQEFDNAAWSSSSSGVAAPTITANAATAPDGTLTAERIVVPATASGQFSYIFQGGFSTIQAVTTIYVRGNGSSGSINVLSGPSPNACVSCAYVSTSWTRCEILSAVGAGNFVFVGNDSASAVCGTGSKGAIDAFIWGAQHEVGDYATSYIPTVAAAVTRNAESTSFTAPAIATTSSMAATVVLAGVSAGNQSLLAQFNSGGNFYQLRTVGGQAYSTTAANNSTFGAALTAGVPARLATFNGAGDLRETCRDGSCSAGATATAYTRPAASLQIGYISTAEFLDGIISRVCVDPDPSRCR